MLNGMEHSIAGFLSYFGIFVFIFGIVWITEFFTGKHNIRKMNERLHKAKN